MKVTDNHNIPLFIRILGLLFDPQLNWNQHINNLEKRIKYKLYQLQRISYSEKYQLSTHAIWQLYIITIRPIIEYGMAIYGNQSNLNKLQKLQNKAVRIALRAKKTTKMIYLNTLLNVQSLQQRLEIIRCKLWAKSTRAHQSLLQYYNYNAWYQFVINNNGNTNLNYNTRSNKYNISDEINTKQFSYLNQ
jgi:hypothetical protein